MLVNNGLGDSSDSSLVSDILIPPSIDPVSLGVLVLAGGLVIYYALRDSKTKSIPKETRIKTRKPESKTFNQDDNEVIQALVSQGAKKNEAKLAVSRAKTNGARGFEALFRGALKEL